MKYFQINGQIDKECFDSFASFYNENQKEKCTITIFTGGGDNYISQVIVKMINEMEDVTMIIQAVYSAGFRIAYLSKCKKILCHTAKGMWHYGRAELHMGVNNKPFYLEDRCMVDNFTFEKKDCKSLAKEVMTKKELKLFKNDRDVYFNFKRMKEIFKNADILE